MMTRSQLYEWRNDQGLTIKEAGTLVGVKSRTWAAWEGGQNPVPQMLENLLLCLTILQYQWHALLYKEKV